jgi:hypothetical protein
MLKYRLTRKNCLLSISSLFYVGEASGFVVSMSLLPKLEKPAIIKSGVADYVLRGSIISDAQTLLGINSIENRT